MGRFQANTTEEQENSLCPEGLHIMRITEVDDSKTTKNGDWMAIVQFEVVKGEHAGLKATDCIIVPKANSPAIGIMWKTRLFLKSIGEPSEGALSGNTENWYRKVTKVRVFHDKYNGRKNAKIAEYLPMESTEADGIEQPKESDIPF